MVQIDELLAQLTKSKASDLHLKVGSQPFVRINGRLERAPFEELSAEDTEAVARELLPRSRAKEFAESGETDFALSIPQIGRFRVSALRQRGTVSIVLRRVLTNPPSIDALGLPSVLKNLSNKPNGLIVVSGPGDSGKTTTVSAMLDEINSSKPSSILTVEDPIEILHTDKTGFVLQREVGSDTESHIEGLTRSMRHDVDVIYIDAIPSLAVLEGILAAATARLVIAVLPALGVDDTVQRLLNFFPSELEDQGRVQLASVLQGVLSQRLLPRADRRGRVAAFEVLVNHARVQANLLARPDAMTIDEILRDGDYNGMHTLDQHLEELYAGGAIDYDTAMSAAQDAHDMRIALALVGDPTQPAVR